MASLERMLLAICRSTAFISSECRAYQLVVVVVARLMVPEDWPPRLLILPRTICLPARLFRHIFCIRVAPIRTISCLSCRWLLCRITTTITRSRWLLQ